MSRALVSDEQVMRFNGHENMPVSRVSREKYYPYKEDTIFGRTYHACAEQGVEHDYINIDPVRGRV